MTTATKPNPGSPEAIANGCRCPIAANNCGMTDEHGQPLFWRNTDCPLHGEAV